MEMKITEKPTVKTKSKIILFYSFMILLPFCFSFFVGEISLRIVKYAGKDYQPFPWKVPVICRHDQILGWRPNPGKYIFPPYSWTKDGLTLTILPSGARATGPYQTHKSRSLVAIGCSITQGWEISDNETFMYKLKDRYPHIEMINIGCLGYGTYQSFLLLKEYLKNFNNVDRKSVV